MEGLGQERHDLIYISLNQSRYVISKEFTGRQPEFSLGGHGRGQVSHDGGLAGGGKKWIQVHFGGSKFLAGCRRW